MEVDKELPEDPMGNLITKAHDDFIGGNYDKCLASLDELETAGGINEKLRHNRAVVQYYKTGESNYDELFKFLGEFEEPDDKSDDTNPGAGNPIARYNRALICYHRRCYYQAINLLMPLLDNMDSLDETAALAIALMLRLLIATNQLNKAMGFMHCLLKRLGVIMQEAIAAEDSALPQHLASIPGFSRTFKQLLFLTNILNNKTVVIPDEATPEFSALKAHKYYIMKDFQMAAKQLMKINEENNANNELNTIIANNMGVIHLRVRHYALAAKFFQNALSFDVINKSDVKKLSLQSLGKMRSCEVLYNMGISHLYLRRPQEAFDCFLIPLKRYHNNPRLWYRISEACIMHHEMSPSIEDKLHASCHSPEPPTPQSSNTDNFSDIVKPVEISLDFAAICLRNALTLTKNIASIYYTRESDDDTSSAGASSSDTDGDANWKNSKENNHCNPSIPVTRDDLDNLLSCIYAAFSYVSLRLGDYVTALEMAEQLMSSKNISDTHKLLARMYAGEALLMMDKLTEAKPHLDPAFVTTLNELDFETKDWEVKSLDAAQNIVRYNLAMAMCKQGDIDSAIALLNSCTHEIVAKKIKAFRRFLNAKFGKCT